LLRCLTAIEKLKLHDDEAVGVGIVKRALEEPARQIAHNAGAEGAVVIGKIRESKDENFGYNADTGDYGDMVKMGVIDPAKVTRLALQNAASIAGLMLHHRSAGCRTQGRREEGCGGWRRSGWSGRRHGRHVLNLIRQRESFRAGRFRPARFF